MSVQLTLNNSELDNSRQWRMREHRPIYSPVGSLKEHHSVGFLHAISIEAGLIDISMQNQRQQTSAVVVIVYS